MDVMRQLEVVKRIRVCADRDSEAFYGPEPDEPTLQEADARVCGKCRHWGYVCGQGQDLRYTEEEGEHGEPPGLYGACTTTYDCLFDEAGPVPVLMHEGERCEMFEPEDDEDDAP